mgnify:CR=1 FL=1|jgi:hypothetical protein
MGFTVDWSRLNSQKLFRGPASIDSFGTASRGVRDLGLLVPGGSGREEIRQPKGPSTGGDPHVINFVIPATNKLIVNALRSAAKVF